MFYTSAVACSVPILRCCCGDLPNLGLQCSTRLLLPAVYLTLRCCWGDLPNLVLQCSTRLLLPAVDPPFVAAVVIFLTLAAMFYTSAVACSVPTLRCCCGAFYPFLLQCSTRLLLYSICRVCSTDVAPESCGALLFQLFFTAHFHTCCCCCCVVKGETAFCTATGAPCCPVDDGECGVVDAEQHGHVGVVNPAQP